MLHYTLKLLLLLSLLFGFAFTLHVPYIAVHKELERQQESWEVANHRINKLEHRDLVRVFYGFQKKGE